MLTITIQGKELWDERNQEFISVKPQKLQLEHSLISLSKWESKWERPFISKKPMTTEETIDYIRCMTLTSNVDPSVYSAIGPEEIKQVSAYIEKPMTATWFKDKPGSHHSSEAVTSELIYYWMIALNIPMECQKWHLNRLLTLIKVCSIKSDPKQKKMSKQAIMNQNHSLNAARRRASGSKG